MAAELCPVVLNSTPHLGDSFILTVSGFNWIKVLSTNVSDCLYPFGLTLGDFFFHSPRRVGSGFIVGADGDYRGATLGFGLRSGAQTLLQLAPCQPGITALAQLHGEWNGGAGLTFPQIFELHLVFIRDILSMF